MFVEWWMGKTVPHCIISFPMLAFFFLIVSCLELNCSMVSFHPLCRRLVILSNISWLKKKMVNFISQADCWYFNLWFFLTTKWILEINQDPRNLWIALSGSFYLSHPKKEIRSNGSEHKQRTLNFSFPTAVWCKPFARTLGCRSSHLTVKTVVGPRA